MPLVWATIWAKILFSSASNNTSFPSLPPVSSVERGELGNASALIPFSWMTSGPFFATDNSVLASSFRVTCASLSSPCSFS
eukprot:m.116607 g.116607  ORF g.116607 m.116607 type:complete len:81 (+) comp14470_c2_seq2:242-484(+)